MGSTILTIPAVQLNGLHVGLQAVLNTKVKSGKNAGKAKAILIDEIKRVEHDGKVVRVYRKIKSPQWWGAPEEGATILEFTDMVEVTVPNGN